MGTHNSLLYGTRHDCTDCLSVSRITDQKSHSLASRLLLLFLTFIVVVVTRLFFFFARDFFFYSRLILIPASFASCCSFLPLHPVTRLLLSGRK